MPENKPFTVHYRRMQDPVGALNGNTLEACVRGALQHVVAGKTLSDHWKHRTWVVPPAESDTLLMNVFHDDGTSFFGDLTAYTHGFMQALLRSESDVAMLPVEQQPPPEGREYIHSMMYWMVLGNHVLVIQSRSLKTKHLEKYLTWLLKDTAQMGDNGQVLLTAKFDSEDVGGELDDLREIIVGGVGVVDAMPVRRPEQPAERVSMVAKRVDIGAQISWGKRAYNVLRAIMSNEADVQKLLESIPREADLDVSVHIGYKAKKRRVTRAPMQQALRNLPEGEVTAIGKHGRMTGKDIRLSFPVQVLCEEGLPKPNDVRAKLKSVYHYFVENGKIEA